MAATKTPKLDSYIKIEVSKPAKIADNELARFQSFVLDSVAPLTSIFEADARGDEISHKQAVDTTTAALTLIGNSSAQISHLRRSKLVSNMNKALLPLVEDDSNFPPSLFGPEFGLKTMWNRSRLYDPPLMTRSFFEMSPTTAGGALPKTKEPRLLERRTPEFKRTGRETGTNKCLAHRHSMIIIQKHMLHVLSYNMGTSALPDMYARSLRTAGPRAEGIHIRQSTSAHIITNMSHFWHS